MKLKQLQLPALTVVRPSAVAAASVHAEARKQAAAAAAAAAAADLHLLGRL
jgi:hypothetical protein